MAGTILMTGAAGRLGTLLRGPFARAGHDVRLSDRLKVKRLLTNESFERADLTSARAMRKICRGVSVIVHLGGIADETDWKTLADANIEGLLTLMQAAREAGASRFIFASTMHVLGMHPRTDAIDETSAAAPDTRYAATKAFGEAACRIAADKDGMAVTVLRIGHVVASVRDAAPGMGIAAEDFVGIVEIALAQYEPGFRLFHAVAPHRGYPLSDGRLAREHRFKFAQPGPDRAELMETIERSPVFDALGRTVHGGDFAQRR
jgi:uronate dehydrogenase